MCVFLLAAPPFVPPLSLCPLFQAGYTALNWASSNGHAKVVELLRAAKADTNLKNIVSPPSERPHHGDAKVVELLLAAKADKNLKSNVSPPPTPSERERERTKDPLSPNACTCPPTLTKGPHVPSRLRA